MSFAHFLTNKKSEAIASLSNNFITLLKQQGALLAKGRLLGIQFDRLFTDELYFKISKHFIVLYLACMHTSLQKQQQQQKL